MKKLLFTALALLLAAAGFGGSIHAVHAQTLSSSDAASLEQSLAVTRARLVNLEMQEGIVPAAGDDQLLAQALPGSVSAPSAPTTVVTPATNLSASDKAAIVTALGSLAQALQGLQSELAANPQIATTNSAQIVGQLQTIGNTLAAIVSTVESGQGTGAVATTPTPAPVAVNNPAPKTPAVAQSNPGSTSKAPSAAPTQTQTPTPQASTPAAQPATQNTAQASSIWSFAKSHWPTITIILLIVLMLVILFWPHEDDEPMTAKSAPNRAGPGPAKPMNSQQPNSSTTVVRAPASTVAPTAVRVEPQQAKVTVIRPPEPRKKTA